MEDAQRTQPCELAQQQLHFFSIPNGRGNTLLDYDLIPRFLHDRANKRHPISDQKSVAPRAVSLTGKEVYHIHPATIMVKEKDGSSRPYAVYPGTRESIIEDCLIFFARNGEFSVERGEPGYVYEGDTLGVCFTLNQLRSALKGMSKEYRLDELKEGLDVLAMANYQYQEGSTGRERTCRYVVASLDSIPNPSPNDKMRSDRIVYVVFDSYVKRRIMSGHYRTYDDKCAMSMRSPIARYLYKQFSHYWQHANNKNEAGSIRSVDQNETILASGCSLPDNPTKRKSKVTKALYELASTGVIQEFSESDDIVPIRDGRKTIDNRFMVRPTNGFITQQIEGYKRLQKSIGLGQKIEDSPTENKMLGN
jgi:hypothetical protein